MSLPFPCSPGVRCQMSIHCVWVTVCWTGAGLVIAGRPRKQLRRRVAHQRASNLWVAGDSVVWERWQLQQVRCKGSGSINKCQSKMSRCGRRSGWDVPQRQAPMSLLLFRLIFVSNSYCCRAAELIGSGVLQKSPCSPLCFTSGLKRSLPGPSVASRAIWPFALSQGVKEHQINSTHWRIKSPGLYHTKAAEKCVAFSQFPQRRQLSLQYMHMDTLNTVYDVNTYIH